MNTSRKPAFIYTYACRKDEISLCALEMRSFFGVEASEQIFKSPIQIDPSRSPFIRERIDIMFEGDTLEDIYDQVHQVLVGDATFRVLFVKTNDLHISAKVEYVKRRAIEREIGLRIEGEADIQSPELLFGIVPLGGRWYFGPYDKNKAVWFHHMKKPRNYSIALTTRIARAAANIAVPNPVGIKAIDPCCGIGTVLVEALSMGIDIVGRDINPFIARGARQNIAHFGLNCEVTLGAIENITSHYDVAIIDMPYNLFSSTTPEEQHSILQHARRIASKVIVITIETIDVMIESVGFTIADRCVAKKGMFSRQILVCT